MISFMLDTNTLDYVFDHDLLEKLSLIVESKRIQLIICRVQMDEIEKITEHSKKQYIELIPYEKIPVSVGWIGVEDRFNRGFLAPRVGWVNLVDEGDAKIINQYRRKRTDTHPVGNEGDLSIVFTAVKQKLNYLVSNDMEVKRLHQKLKADFHSDLNFIDNETFVKYVEENDFPEN